MFFPSAYTVSFFVDEVFCESFLHCLYQNELAEKKIVGFKLLFQSSRISFVKIEWISNCSFFIIYKKSLTLICTAVQIAHIFSNITQALFRLPRLFYIRTQKQFRQNISKPDKLELF